MNYDEIKRKIDEENKRHEETIRSLEEELKKAKELESAPEKIKPVPVTEQTVYFVPEHEPERHVNQIGSVEQIVYTVPKEEKTENHQSSSKVENVYFVPERKKEKKSFLSILKNIFGTKKKTNNQPVETEPIYMESKPKERQREEVFEDTSHVYIGTNEDNDREKNDFSEIILYAKKLKEDKEKHKIIQNKYLETAKTGNKEKTDEIKNELWESQNKILLAESFLRNKLKENRKSELSQEEKTKIINYICGIARIKAKTSPKHLKKEDPASETTKDTIEQLNKRKEKINSSQHFTKSQKRNIIQQIDDEIIELSKTDDKSRTK